LQSNKHVNGNVWITGLMTFRWITWITQIKTY